jgi:hypothetical protein
MGRKNKGGKPPKGNNSKNQEDDLDTNAQDQIQTPVVQEKQAALEEDGTNQASREKQIRSVHVGMLSLNTITLLRKWAQSIRLHRIVHEVS